MPSPRGTSQRRNTLERDTNDKPVQDKKVIVVTGGGTGGHLYPALAVVEELQTSTDVELHYIGLKKERDQKEVQSRGIPFYGLRLAGLKRRLTFQNLRAVWYAVAGWIGCLRILKTFGKGVVFGVGGYVSAPAMLAGKILGWKLALHEQNAIPGLVNRNLARFCDRVFLTYVHSQRYFPGLNCRCTGMPIRKAVRETAHREPSQRENKPPLVFVMGGSQGARKLVEITLPAFRQLEGKKIAFQAVVQTGERNYEWAKTLPTASSVTLVPFIEDMASMYRQTDVVVSRAGSGSLSEIALWGFPSILVPYPYASDDHQRKNAEEFQNAKAAYLCDEADLNQENAAMLLEELLTNREKRIEMGKQAKSLAHDSAATVIASQLLDLWKVNE